MSSTPVSVVSLLPPRPQPAATERQRTSPLQERISANKRRTLKLAVIFGAIVFVLFGFFIFLLSGSFLASIVVGLAVAATWVFVGWLRGDSVVLDLCDTIDARPQDHARLFNVVNGLRAAMGLPALDLYVVDDPALNALAVGRDPNHASLVITQGLLEDASLVELEGVIALQLYRIKVHDTAPETFVVPTFGAPAVLSEAADRFEKLARFLKLPMPWIDAVLAKVHPAHSEIETDIAATHFTRYPPALAAVLGKMAGRSAPAVAAPVTAHLWAAPPLAPSANPTAARFHATLSERVAVLEEL